MNSNLHVVPHFRHLAAAALPMLLGGMCVAADHFADAEDSPFNTWVVESNHAATSEPAEPTGIGYKTIWRKFTTTQRCIVTVKTPESPPIGINHWLTVFRGDSYQALNLVESAQGVYGGASVSFPAEAGMTFRICLGSFWSSESANMTFAVLQSTWPYAAGTVVIPAEPVDQAPPNDRFDSAQAIPTNVTSATLIGYLGSARAQPDESFDKTGVPAVWYSWKAPFNGPLRISTPRTPNILGFGHRLSVFTGSNSSALKSVASGLASASIIGPEHVDLSFAIVAGTTYRISFGYASYLNGFGDERFSYVMRMQATKLNPDIAVQQPAGSNLTDGKSRVAFGSAAANSGKLAKTFRIKNTGRQTLQNIKVSVTGKHPSEFKVKGTIPGTLKPGASVTFKVVFGPKAAGSRAAVLKIRSNDPDENPFNVKLSGVGK